MSEEEKYIKCKNCHQNILESKMFLHEGFCLRNNKLCPECDKVFLIQEYEEHLKTHNSKNISNQKKSPISEHRKNCHHNENPKKDNPQPVIPKKKEIKVDDNLGLEKCEYCANVVEDLKEHLENCEVKKMIEIENAKYYSDLERRKKEDDDLAKKLAKEKMMDISNDEEMAKNLQKELQMQNIDISKDEELAIKLQNQFQQQQNVNISEDEKLAKELQNQLNQDFNNNIQNDEEYARMLQQQQNIGNNNNNNNFNNYNDFNNNMGQDNY